MPITRLQLAKMSSNIEELRSMITEVIDAKLEQYKIDMNINFDGKINEFAEAIDVKFNGISGNVVKLNEVVTNLSDGMSMANEDLNAVSVELKAVTLEVNKNNLESAKVFAETLDRNVSSPKTLQANASSKESVITPSSSNHAVPSIAKVPTYDGQFPWSTYKVQYNLIANANGWNSVEKAKHLASALRGSAVEVLHSVPSEHHLDYDCLVSAFDLRYGDTHLKECYSIGLRNRSQKSNETLQEMALDVERMTRLAYSGCPLDVQDQLARQYFIDAIHDVDIQHSTRMADTQSLRMAVVHAMKFEANREASRGSTRNVRAANIEDSSVNETNRLLLGMLKRLEVLEKQNNSSKERENFSIRCWNCGRMGHVQAHCKQTGYKRFDNNKQGNEQ